MLKNDFFWISQGKVATSDRWGGQVYKVFISNQLIFDIFIQKIKKWIYKNRNNLLISFTYAWDQFKLFHVIFMPPFIQ